MLFKMGAWHIPEKAAHLRSLYAHLWAYPGKKLLFMGSEFAQSSEWKHDRSLEWHLCQYPDHEGVRRLVRDLNRLYLAEPILNSNDFNPQGFRWIAAHDTDANIIAYLRLDVHERVLFLVVCHLGGGDARHGYRVGVPRRGLWKEVLNSNSEYYGGTGLGNGGARQADEVPVDGLSHSLALTLPPATTMIFKWTQD
jgi:1,4-alpha-glucan branching enzyme